MHNKQKINLLFFLSQCFGLTINAPVYAQETKAIETTSNSKSQEKDVNTRIQQVDVKARSEAENVKHLAAGKTIVTNEQLNRYGDSNIIDAMKHVPGVLVSDDSITLPGLSGAYTRLLVDGESPRGVSIKDLPLIMIDRVEISRLGSAEFSSQSIGGIINIILKRNPDSKQNTYKADFYHHNWLGTDVSWYSADKSGDLSYSTTLTANYEPLISNAPEIVKTTELNTNGVPQQEYISIDKGRRDNYYLSFSPRLQFKMNNRTSLTFSTSINGRTSHSARDYEVYPSFGKNIEPSKQWGHFERKSTASNSELRVKTNIFENIKLDLNTTLNFGVRESNGFLNRIVGTSPVQNSQLESSSRQFGFSNSGKLTLPFESEHFVVAGWSLARKSSHFKENDRDSAELKTETKNSTTVDKSAFFAQDEWQIGKRSSLYLGLRWESLRLQNALNLQKSLSHEFNILSPIVQSLWRLNTENEDRLRFGISRAYNPPSVEQLAQPKTKTFLNTILIPSALANPELRPELAWSLSAAYEHEAKDGWNYNLRYTLRSIKDAHQKFFNYDQNTWLSTTINSGDAQSKLLEFDTTFPLKRFLGNAPNIDFSLYTYKNWSNISTLPKPYNAMTPIAWNVNFRMEYKAKDLPLNIGTSFIRDGSRWVQVSVNSRSYESRPPYLSTYLLWKFDKKTKFNASIDNLLKRPNDRVVDYLGLQTKTSSQLSIPGYRSIHLTVEYEL
ncbi:MAG: TonB-dependent receptor [Undibacterium sp.]|nr:TonB-dependent receptor [Undibacterium sp.]